MTDAVDTDAVRIEDVGPVRYVRFDRPKRLNAFRVQDLQDAVRAVREAPEDCAVIVFGGTGRALAAGMDLNTFVGVVDEPDTTRQVIGAVREMLDTVRTAQVATIAAVDGYCLGAAFELILACDLRIVTPRSKFGLPEINLGLPCILDAAVLQQYVGLSRAKEIMLTGNIYDTEQLDQWGLFNTVVSEDAFHDRVQRSAAELAAKPRLGVASQKRLFEHWQNSSLVTGIEASMDEIDLVFHDPSTREIVHAAAAGRK